MSIPEAMEAQDKERGQAEPGSHETCWVYSPEAILEAMVANQEAQGKSRLSTRHVH